MTVTTSAREVAVGLSRYLCGTHSRLPAVRASIPGGTGPRWLQSVVGDHRVLGEPIDDGVDVKLGAERWEFDGEGALGDALRSSLRHPAVIDLIFFGSQARGGLTGFSDVDAILVITDDVAESPEHLQALRPRVLAAQRAVLAYQPMQHHGFEIATAKLLRRGGQALALPAVALAETKSLKGTGAVACFADVRPNRSALDALAGSLRRLRSWPAHVWEAHRHVAMFELLPVLYLQARGAWISKARSFDEARTGFGPQWWPYDVLAEVRRLWPRLRRQRLEQAASAVRNPWLAVAAWRRFPASLPSEVRPLLTPNLLDGLHSLAASMVEQAR
jgi:hypothetical protein